MQKLTNKIRKIRTFLLLEKPPRKLDTEKTGPRRCHTTGFDNAERIADMTWGQGQESPVDGWVGDGMDSGGAKNIAPHLGVEPTKNSGVFSTPQIIH